MGETIEQYRARIGAHNNRKIKRDPSRITFDLSDILLVVFQLLIANILLLLLVQISYLNILYLPSNTKCVKHLCQIALSFNQMSCNNVYVPLLLRMANDVEENPGPTVYDVVDPTKTICADFSQGDTRKFRQNAGKQCLAMSLTAIIHSRIVDVNIWDTSLLNNILYAGNNLYTFISKSVNKSYLLLTDVPEMVSIFDKVYQLQYSDSLAGNLFMETTNLPYYCLENALHNLFYGSQLSYQHCMLTINCNTMAIFKTSEVNFKIFDSHSRDSYGIPHPIGKSVLVSVEGIQNLAIYFKNTVPRGDAIPFEIKGVTVDLANYEIENETDIAIMSDKGSSLNERLKQKRSMETGPEKQKRLKVTRNYKNYKRAVETEAEREVRLETDRKYHQLKKAGETELAREIRLEKNRNCHKLKKTVETETEKLIRHENNRNCHKFKKAVETESEKELRLKRDREYRRNKRANDTAVEKQVEKSKFSDQSELNICPRSRENCTMVDSEIPTQENYLKEFDLIKNGSIHEQMWAKANIKKFHKSVEFFISKCSICHEAWPLKSKPNLSTGYICKQCSRDKKSPKKFSFENSMIPSSVPQELKDLTQVEEMLIARALPIMRVYIKPGGQRGYSGHCINLPQNVKELAISLPRYPKELSVIIVKAKGKNDTFKDVTVRKQKVQEALLWLIQNNPYYSDLQVNEDALNLLPENGVPPDLMTVETDDDIVSDDNCSPDVGPPTDNPTEDIVYNDSTEMSSFLPVGEQQQQEIEAVRNQLTGNDPMQWPSVENEPLNEYQISHLATMAFPTLFPDGKGDPTNSGILRDVPLQERVKHLLKFAEMIDGKWVYRFASHPRFSYWAFNMIQRK